MRVAAVIVRVLVAVIVGVALPVLVMMAVLMIVLVLMPAAVVMVVMVTVMLVTVAGARPLVHPELRRRHAGAQHAVDADLEPVNRQASECGSQPVERQARVEQRAEQHVARHAGETVEIQKGHSRPVSLKLQYRPSPTIT